MILYQNIVSSGLLLFLMFLLLTVFLAGSLTFLNFRYLAFEKNINDQQSRVIQTETIKTMQSRIDDLNGSLSALKKIQDGKSNLYEVLDKVNAELFKEVKIYSLQIDRNSKLITVSGFSPLRENLVKIRETIDNNPNYKEVEFPLANLANPININFRFSFTYGR